MLSQAPIKSFFNIGFGPAGAITATGKIVNLNATAGVITGNAAVFTNVTANTVNAMAASGIGATNAIELSAANIDAQTTTGAIGLTNAAMTVGGRNLKLWMNDAYTGIDPEINPASVCSGSGTNCNFLTGTEAFGVPIPRTFTFALRIGF